MTPMPRAGRLWFSLAALLGAVAVVLGALGSHAFDVIDPVSFRLANQYHLAHTLALLATAAAGVARSFSAPMHIACGCFALGILLFCGSLYTLALGGPELVARAAPLGGSLLILGWLVLAVNPWRRN